MFNFLKGALLTGLSLFLMVSAGCRSDGSGGGDRDTTPGSQSSGAADVRTGATNAGAIHGGSVYDIDRPFLAAALHGDLVEISGLTVLPDGRLGAVQDEDGVVFVLGRESGEIVERWSFGGAGDYEGIEHAGDRVFVLRSDGTLIEISGWAGDAPATRVIETVLTERNDTEGLTYDASRNRLLIACKERPGAGLGDRYKSIYAFDLTALDLTGDALLPDPVFTIDREAVERQSGENGEFKPSALAVHPATGAVYVLSSTTQVMAVLDGGGVLQSVIQLSPDLFEQPEGLAFLPDGTLYISSEGDDGPGMLYAFRAETGGR